MKKQPTHCPKERPVQPIAVLSTGVCTCITRRGCGVRFVAIDHADSEAGGMHHDNLHDELHCHDPEKERIVHHAG
jgi:hypothetical protein